METKLTDKQSEIERRSFISLDEFITYGPDAALKFLDFIETPDYKKSKLKLTMSQLMDFGGFCAVNRYLDFIFLHGEQVVTGASPEAVIAQKNQQPHYMG